MESNTEYRYADAEWGHHTGYLLKQIDVLAQSIGPGLRVLDVGCGNGAISAWFHSQGCTVVGIDASPSGIEMARKAHPDIRFEEQLIETDLLDRLQEDPFDLVISTEVVEHLYAPRDWANGSFHALKPGGHLIGTTPYHGYIKNLAISITGKFDSHVNPLWDCGHIKFFSPGTLSELYREAGFTNITWRGAGRLPLLWKSMVMRGQRPL
ncbi:MAG: SAM-dependent methyltransferase [Phycisphaerae bacterium]|nr:SAM-dependent methyltransferase [Phycisphaerae bacterium]